MKTFTLAVLLLSGLFANHDSAFAFGRAHHHPAPTPAPTPASYSYNETELEGIRVINDYRASIGLGTVSQNEFISAQCLNHNNYMIQKNKVSHDYFTARADAIQSFLHASRVGEIIAFNFGSPQGALSGWLNSDGHRKIIQNGAFKRIGYSIRSDANGKKYYTAIFSD